MSKMWLFIVVACLIPQVTFSKGLIRHQNPQQSMSISEIIQYWEYPSQEYEVLTDDGYYLQVNRIPSGKHAPNKRGPKPSVLLLHGFGAEGRCWIANLPNNSLAFVLADSGYDVWILNNRGTTWSRRHKTLSNNQNAFWDFSFHEMGMYDVPATINFIQQKTKVEGLYVISQAQGSTLGLIAFSAMPELAKKIKLFVCLAPTYTMVDIKGPTLPFMLLPEGFIRLVWGNKEFSLLNKEMKKAISTLCSYKGLDRICLEFIFMSEGRNENNLNVSRVDVYLGLFPDSSSVKTPIHWNQVFKSKEFKQFDYGSNNKIMYNMTTPPFYKIEDMTVPTAVWNGGKDLMTSKKDIELLLPRIPNLVFYKYIPDWQHVDFLWGLDAPERLFPDMLYLMKQYI
ncbi:lipase member M-like isoform X2 [Hemicordylus capensis]|uniref:lipase member M-like isoform X2 n=1 Tax=Hemicordylus capensis TaxID=884348 RepID=UPI002304B1C6|nr:lipase member M-like isoform X2 [Hemicordylus capensis]